MADQKREKLELNEIAGLQAEALLGLLKSGANLDSELRERLMAALSSHLEGVEEGTEARLPILQVDEATQDLQALVEEEQKKEPVLNGKLAKFLKDVLEEDLDYYIQADMEWAERGAVLELQIEAVLKVLMGSNLFEGYDNYNFLVWPLMQAVAQLDIQARSQGEENFGKEFVFAFLNYILNPTIESEISTKISETVSLTEKTQWNHDVRMRFIVDFLNMLNLSNRDVFVNPDLTGEAKTRAEEAYNAFQDKETFLDEETLFESLKAEVSRAGLLPELQYVVEHEDVSGNLGEISAFQKFRSAAEVRQQISLKAEEAMKIRDKREKQEVLKLNNLASSRHINDRKKAEERIKEFVKKWGDDKDLLLDPVQKLFFATRKDSFEELGRIEFKDENGKFVKSKSEKAHFIGLRRDLVRSPEKSYEKFQNNSYEEINNLLDQICTPQAMSFKMQHLREVYTSKVLFPEEFLRSMARDRDVEKGMEKGYGPVFVRLVDSGLKEIENLDKRIEAGEKVDGVKQAKAQFIPLLRAFFDRYEGMAFSEQLKEPDKSLMKNVILNSFDAVTKGAVNSDYGIDDKTLRAYLRGADESRVDRHKIPIFFEDRKFISEVMDKVLRLYFHLEAEKKHEIYDTDISGYNGFFAHRDLFLEMCRVLWKGADEDKQFLQQLAAKITQPGRFIMLDLYEKGIERGLLDEIVEVYKTDNSQSISIVDNLLRREIVKTKENCPEHAIYAAEEREKLLLYALGKGFNFDQSLNGTATFLRDVYRENFDHAEDVFDKSQVVGELVKQYDVLADIAGRMPRTEDAVKTRKHNLNMALEVLQEYQKKVNEQGDIYEMKPYFDAWKKYFNFLSDILIEARSNQKGLLYGLSTIHVECDWEESLENLFFDVEFAGGKGAAAFLSKVPEFAGEMDERFKVLLTEENEHLRVLYFDYMLRFLLYMQRCFTRTFVLDENKAKDRYLNRAYGDFIVKMNMVLAQVENLRKSASDSPDREGGNTHITINSISSWVGAESDQGRKREGVEEKMAELIEKVRVEIRGDAVQESRGLFRGLFRRTAGTPVLEDSGGSVDLDVEIDKYGFGIKDVSRDIRRQCFLERSAKDFNDGYFSMLRGDLEWVNCKGTDSLVYLIRTVREISQFYKDAKEKGNKVSQEELVEREKHFVDELLRVHSRLHNDNFEDYGGVKKKSFEFWFHDLARDIAPNLTKEAQLYLWQSLNKNYKFGEADCDPVVDAVCERIYAIKEIYKLNDEEEEKNSALSAVLSSNNGSLDKNFKVGREGNGEIILSQKLYDNFHDLFDQDEDLRKIYEELKKLENL